MLRLVIGNRAYSSWSMRGWLAAKQSGLPFDEIMTPLYDGDWADRRQQPDLRPSGGKVPILWDGDVAVWDSLAIIDHLAEKVGDARFWPADPVARGMARSMAAEMHSGYLPLRRACSMNVRRRYPAKPLDDDLAADVRRITDLWAEARSRFGAGGSFLFGDFSAVDIMFAPVVTRFETYAIPLPADARAYCDAILAYPWVRDWIDRAQDEPWVIERFEQDRP